MAHFYNNYTKINKGDNFLPKFDEIPGKKKKGKKIANGFHFLSKRKGNFLDQSGFSQCNLRHFWVEKNASLEFFTWHNGGGIFHRTACIDQTVLIEKGAIVHSNSVLDADVHIGSGTVVGPSVSIGCSTNVGYNTSLSNCSVGMLCTIHNGACIGQDGFGFFVDEEGHVVKKPQELGVKIGNHVEIGANTCIDRGSWRDTTIGDHTKIDNLVQIGHNVVIGKCCMLCGQVGIAGSVTMGDYVVMGGRSAVKDHVSIASKVRIAGNSCVIKDVTESGDYGGFPAVPIREWCRQCAKLREICKKE